MTTPRRICVVSIDGNVDVELYRDLVCAEVCDEQDDMSSFCLKIGIHLKADGTWTRLDDAPDRGGFAPWQRIRITAGFEGSEDVLFDGYVAGVAPYIAPQSSDSYLLVWGYDASFAMDQDEKVVPWEDTKISDATKTIFESYGLRTDNVQDTEVVHAKDEFMLVQRGTDWQFVRLLGEKLGYEVYVRGVDAHFHPPRLTGKPQKDLALHFGPAATNLVWFNPQVVGDRVNVVQKSRIDAANNKIERIEVEQSPLRPLAKTGGSKLRSGRDAAGKGVLLARPEPAVSEQEMEQLVAGLRRHSDWIVTAEGEIDGQLYGACLKANRSVLVKGVGRQFSGIYYVNRVVHQITHASYQQRFWARRNGIGIKGNEDFDGTEVTETEVEAEPRDPEATKTNRSGRKVRA